MHIHEMEYFEEHLKYNHTIKQLFIFSCNKIIMLFFLLIYMFNLVGNDQIYNPIPANIVTMPVK